MSLTIRLARHGSKKKPYYRVVVTDSRKKTTGAPTEQVGTFLPRGTLENTKLDLARIDHWIGLGAQPTETVAALIKAARGKGAGA